MPVITRSLNVIARCGNQYRGAKLAALDLTAAQAPYILHSCAHAGLSQDQLAKALHVNPSNATRQLGSLEEKGYIIREAPPDNRRLLLIQPTEKARKAAPQIHEVNRQWNDYLTRGLQPAELEQLENLMQLMLSRAVCWEESEAAQE